MTGDLQHVPSEARGGDRARPVEGEGEDSLPDITVSVPCEDWRTPSFDPEQVALGAATQALAVTRSVGPATQAGGRGVELSVVFGDDAFIAGLNARYSGRNKPTNVLSFPDRTRASGAPGDGALNLGDVVLARETVIREAAAAGLTVADHVGHLVVHGLLHLLGFDHEADAEAAVMEQLETRILAHMGVADPYGEPKPL